MEGPHEGHSIHIRRSSRLPAESRPNSGGITLDSAGRPWTSPAPADVDWDLFDSEAYFAKNYESLLREDGAIIRIVADHFQESAQGRPPARAIDVGSGTNLYPALTMLPFAEKITLV